MAALKERKQKEIDTVMTDAKSKHPMSVQDLMRLFGEVSEDSEGRPFIFAAEDDDGLDHHRLVEVDDQDEEAFMGNEE